MGEVRRGAFARGGFTLLEMAIVLAVLGVVSAMAVPRYATTLRHQRVNQAANVVASDLELAGALAAQRRVPLQLRVNPATRGYELVERGSQRVVLRRALGDDSEWKLAGLVATPASAEFLPGGTLSSPVSLVLATPGRQRTVTISRAGLVKVAP